MPLHLTDQPVANTRVEAIPRKQAARPAAVMNKRRQQSAQVVGRQLTGRRFWSCFVLQSGRAGLSAILILILSLLGMIYITQISHVARSGYLLSSLQQEQAKLDRENELLRYRLAGERTLVRANDIATREYQMQPMMGASQLNLAASATKTTAATAQKQAAASTNKPAPQIRFVTAQRPQPATLPALAALPELSIVDRLWNQLVGVGVARAADK